jgi:hypothetical protein
MDNQSAVEYVRRELGINVSHHSDSIFADKIKLVVESFPFDGILLVTGAQHIAKLGAICCDLLMADKVPGGIERIDPWDFNWTIHSTSLVAITNLVDDLIKPTNVIALITEATKLSKSVIITTPYSIDDLDNRLPLSILTNIVPFLFGKL